eukprot:TRINITY_DN24092_c0_g2_i1.p1 TRINITY_DN24092_c0_g2~~TRINITY_DN24092_c0_g2_i1.p1  ORF type:complete len:390 (+),score=83.87 TRINITY_DN24092_c0_g2_i1:42-1172(+)
MATSEQAHISSLEDVGVQVLRFVVDALPALDAARLQMAGAVTREAAAGARAACLKRRGWPAAWTWQRAHAAEVSFLFDALSELGSEWQVGPNTQSAGNRVTSRGGWLELSGGTDWQGFQGIFRELSTSGAEDDIEVMPTWVSFQVRIDSLRHAGAFFGLASGRHTWGLQPLTFLFSYRGDEGKPETRRCFAVQAAAQQEGGIVRYCSKTQVIAGRSYQIRFKLDWKAGRMSVFVDDTEELKDMDFEATQSARFAGFYNWRSAARTSISELFLGDADPGVPPEFRGRGSGDTQDSSATGSQARGLLRHCSRRAVRGSEGASPHRQQRLPRRGLLASALALLVAIAAQRWLLAAPAAISTPEVANARQTSKMDIDAEL